MPVYDPRLDRMAIGKAQSAGTEADFERMMENTQNRLGVEGFDVDMRSIEWPAVEHYGYDHGQQMMNLAHHIAQVQGITNKLELDAVKLAALCHDLGRKQPWQRTEGDPDHNVRSAEACERWLQSLSAPTSLIERASRLVAAHSLSLKEPPKDPLLIALWDADSMEAARLEPGTGEGMTILNKRRARLITEWAKDLNNVKTWMRFRGWKM